MSRKIRQSLATAEKFHGLSIDILSASSINLWLTDRGMWFLRYVRKYKSATNPKFWRGNVVEKTLTMAIQYRHRTAEFFHVFGLEYYDRLMADYLQSVEGEIPHDFMIQSEAARHYVDEALKRIPEARDTFPEPTKSQPRYQMDIGIELPIVCYPDLEFENETMDVKTTDRLPSQWTFKFEKQLSAVGVAPLLLEYQNRQEAKTLDGFGTKQYIIDDTGIAHRFVKKGNKKEGIRYEHYRSTRSTLALTPYDSISENYKRQIALYSKPTKKTPGLYYFGKNRSIVYRMPQEETDYYFEQFRQAALSIRKAIQLTSGNADELRVLCVPNFESFIWDEDAIAAAEKEWGIRIKSNKDEDEE